MRYITLKNYDDWKAIKKNSNELYVFNSFNNPFNYNEKQGRLLFDHLGGILILRNDGHFTPQKKAAIINDATATILTTSLEKYIKMSVKVYPNGLFCFCAILGITGVH